MSIRQCPFLPTFGKTFGKFNIRSIFMRRTWWFRHYYLIVRWVNLKLIMLRLSVLQKCLKSIFPLISCLKLTSMIADCLVKNKASLLKLLTAGQIVPIFLQKKRSSARRFFKRGTVVVSTSEGCKAEDNQNSRSKNCHNGYSMTFTGTFKMLNHLYIIP